MTLLSPSLVRLEVPLTDSLEQMEGLGCESVHIDVCANLTIPKFFKVEELRNVHIQKYFASATVHVFQPFNDNPPDLTFLRNKDLAMLHVFPQTTRLTIEAFIRTSCVGGYRSGLAVDINTKIAEVLPYLSSLDTIFIVAIRAGGCCLEPDARLLQRIKQVRLYLSENNLVCRVGIDGGINANTFCYLAQVADELVVGSLLLNAKDIPSQWSKLCAMVKGGTEG
ncbi:MAG: hypothetical protein WC495_05510 [Patescibacteria group bacterium]|jgi:pentose-5-phosphate-3-epimerase